MSQIVAFNSFRGGTGKSNTTAIAARIVRSRRGYLLNIIDTHIEIPWNSSPFWSSTLR